MTREEAIKYLNEFIFFKKISNTTEGEVVECFKLAVEALQEHQHYKDLAESYEKTINKLTKAIAEPQQKTGHWIGHREHCEKLGVIPSGLGVYEWCSNCGHGIDIRDWSRISHSYCPNCGAKMQEVQE